MKIAVVSDIHSNLEAFTEVLKDIDSDNIKDIISLGDNIGYGPDPEKIIDLLIQRKIVSVMGNHELAVVDPKYLNWFNPGAKEALKINDSLLSDNSKSYISTMELALLKYNCRFVHGAPPDSATTYIFQLSDMKLKGFFSNSTEYITFVGHTHAVGMIEWDGNKITKKPLKCGFTQLNKDSRYIINTGSVGQPRDGNNNAKYLIYDTENRCVELRYIPYDILVTAKKIYLTGIPSQYGRRLF